MKKQLKKLAPAWFIDQWDFFNERVRLNRLNQLNCDTTPLANINHINLVDLFYTQAYEADWQQVQDQMRRVSPSHSGGANTGSYKALYCLIRYLAPTSILEIGTRLGVSAAYMALGLKAACPSLHNDLRLVTVDIEDVNDPRTRPWARYGSKHSPCDMMAKLGCAHFVSFVTANSLDFMAKNEAGYDLIFLDGDHSTPVIYQEISAALKILNPGGWILLHDYFPGLKPLWPDQPPIAGPYLATQRLQKEGANIKILPLNKLPWFTRSNSCTTSLALMGAYQPF
ncbi:MAG TPA: class I SAM-dependent methyltransferase [Anaerolineae bacterium]|nr:class I SAM-dependent methyltransferase [Anaerolineae bacterium]